MWDMVAARPAVAYHACLRTPEAADYNLVEDIGSSAWRTQMLQPLVAGLPVPLEQLSACSELRPAAVAVLRAAEACQMRF